MSFTAPSVGPGSSSTTLHLRAEVLFLKALADTFATHGMAVLEDLAQNDKATFIRVVASLEPKSLAIEQRTPESVLTDEQLEELHEEYTEILARRAAEKAQAAKGDG